MTLLPDAASRLWPFGSEPGELSLRQRLFVERPLLNRLAYRRTRRAVRRRQTAERTPGDVLDTVLDHEPGWDPYRVTALQQRPELAAFLEFLRERSVERVLEVGTFQGGTLYVWARALGGVERVVGVDEPVWTEMVHRRRRRLFRAFSSTVDVDVVYGDSHDDATASTVADAVGDGVDLLFVDGDHSYEGVREDFERYRPLVRAGGVVAFHDIRRQARDEDERDRHLREHEDLPERYVSVGIPRWEGVSELWDELQDGYATREFLSHPHQMGAGIGVVEL